MTKNKSIKTIEVDWDLEENPIMLQVSDDNSLFCVYLSELETEKLIFNLSMTLSTYLDKKTKRKELTGV